MQACPTEKNVLFIGKIRELEQTIKNSEDKTVEPGAQLQILETDNLDKDPRIEKHKATIEHQEGELGGMCLMRKVSKLLSLCLVQRRAI